MLFAHPLVLSLLPVAVALAYLGWRAAAVGSPRTTTAVLRAACIAAVVTALAGPMLGRRIDHATAVIAIELSPAVSDEAVNDVMQSLQKQSVAEAADTPVVVFAARAEVLTDRAVLRDPARLADVRRRLNMPWWADDPAGGGVNPAVALRLAGAQVPANGRGDVRLFATGLSGHGDAAAEAWRLAGRGVAVHIEALDVNRAGLPAVRTRSVSLPAAGRVGQTLSVDVEIESAVACRASIQLAAGNTPAPIVSSALQEGTNHVIVPLPLMNAGLAEVTATAWRDGDAGAPPELFAAVQVSPPANVVLVQDRPDEKLHDTLAALLGTSARLTSVGPEAVVAGLDADAVVLADVPADRLSSAQQAVIADLVRSGSGLLLTGAARSFGPGNYDDSALASLMPVRTQQQTDSIDPSTTLVLVIDTSGSMQGQAIDLAKQIGRLAVSHLKPQDKVGLVEFYGGKRWAAPVQSAANASVIERALDRLSAGGGTTLYPAVEEAAFALRNVQTRSRHLLICSDGYVEDAAFAGLVQRMAEDGITVSAVAVGPEVGSVPNMLPDIARWGGGRFYAVPDEFAMPDLTFKQPQETLLSPVERTPSAIVAGPSALATDTSAWPPVHGYVRTAAKPAADVLLKTISGDPLLVRWRCGAGYVAALPTQLGSTMTQGLQDQPAFAKLMAGLFRQLDDSRGAALRLEARARPAGVEIEIAAAEPGLAAGTLDVSLIASDGRVERTVACEPVTAGRWDVLLPGVTAGAYRIEATLRGSDVRGGGAIAVPPPRSVPMRTPDYTLLTRISGFASLAAEQASLLPAKREDYVDLTKSLVGLALLLFVANVAVRRWPRRGQAR